MLVRRGRTKPEALCTGLPMSHVEAQMSSCVPVPQGREDRGVHLRLGLPVAGLLECALSFCILNVCVCIERQNVSERGNDRHRGKEVFHSLVHVPHGCSTYCWARLKPRDGNLLQVPPWGWQGPHLLPPLTCTRKLVGSDAAGT